MKVTIYDVAREAGVSIAAVSQVINGKGKISGKRRAEIVQVMERLNYKPSLIATALTGKKTYTLGLLVPDISNPFFSEIARAVEKWGHHHGYSLVICSTDNDDERVEQYLSMLQQKRVDGIIIGTGIAEQELLAPLLGKSIPVAMIARELPHNRVDTVIVDDYAGGRLAARHLLELGHTRLAVLSEHHKVTSSLERIRGFRAEIQEAELELSDEWIKASGHDLIHDGKQNLAELMQGDERPTAVFCCNDLLAIGALQAAKDMGISVPGELSIVGFDNTILTTVTDPQLTTIAQPTERMGRLVVELILGIKNRQQITAERMVLTPTLMIRQSTSGR
jgi:DNA-binding LacI/PurR family transcriptional regulator